MADRFIDQLNELTSPSTGDWLVIEDVSANETKKIVAGTSITANTLGTVSQSGGVPTGAIIERGSNANGEFVRFADGAQICTKLKAVASFNNASNLRFDWTYPAAFAAEPVITPQGHYQGFSAKFRQTPHFVYSRAAGASSCQVGFGSDAAWVDGDQSLGETLNIIAIGRWF